MAWLQVILDNCELIHIAREQVVLGGWLFIAPWILGFAAIGPAAWTSWLAGIMIVILAVWKLRELRGQLGRLLARNATGEAPLIKVHRP